MITRLITRLIITIGAGGVYFSFASIALANINHGGPYTLYGSWWGLLATTGAAFLYSLKLIWTTTNH